MLTCQLTGDEALARGAWESGVCLATGYPGSPSTRFLESLVEISKENEVYVEWSANEKVAFEMALGASMGGKRAAVCFKGVGLNVAMDPLMVANLGGVAGGMVVILGDDPGAWGSQNEQDGRLLIRAAEIPLLEFGSPQEAFDMVRYAFTLSEKFMLPVVIRETRTSSAERGFVQAAAERTHTSRGTFADFQSWKILPMRQLDKHRDLHAKKPQVIAEFNNAPFNPMILRGPKGVLGAGYAGAKVLRLAREKGAGELSVLKLGTVYPPPEKVLRDFLSNLEAVLVAEEVQPLIEQHLRSLAHLYEIKVRVYGKDTGHLPTSGEIFRVHLVKAVQEALKVEISPDVSWGQEGFPSGGIPSLRLPPQCPFNHAFQAFSAALPPDPKYRPIFVGDDGCLMRLMNEPFELMDCKFCMGSSIGLASGLAWSGERRKIVALVGDSSFFHTGLSAYVNAVANGARIMIVVLDNRSTAMTGCQSNPGTEFNTRGQRRAGIDLTSLLRSAGIKTFRAVEAFGGKEELATAFKECLESNGLSVLLISGPCPNLTEKIC
jgi:indolepyruvate ferredoxin oxidoreductase alpha subunit